MVSKTRSLRRPNYFTGQLLDQEDFQAEQTYHLESRRRHARELHRYGIVGLEVTRLGPRDVQVSPGLAVDKYGREIVVDQPLTLALTDAAPKGVIYITIEYAEQPDDAQESSGNPAESARVVEYAVVSVTAAAPSPDGPALALARLPLDEKGQIAVIDPAVRQLAGARLAAGSVGTTELGHASVTREKLHPALRSGWVRQPFKPSPFAEARGPKDAKDFIIGATRTYCDESGAKGTVAIPVPAGAERLKQVVVAGPMNQAGIEIVVFRCGWNADTNTPEATASQSIVIQPSAGFFNRNIQLNWSLKADSHGVALYVYAQGRAEISLVAAEFE